jgi:hypothetical protein
MTNTYAVTNSKIALDTTIARLNIGRFLGYLLERLTKQKDGTSCT